ncbi:MAG: ECF-type sigma factor [Pseudomonadota bacterium]
MNQDRIERDAAVGEVTALLHRVAAEGNGLEALYGQVYGELRQQAAAWLRRSPVTLQPTELVAEIYLKLEGSAHQFENRRHFFGACAQALRQLMADHARRRMSEKRGGDQRRVDYAESQVIGADGNTDMFDLSLAIEGLAQESARAARLVELRYFAGLNLEEAAAVLDISTATAGRDWRFGRAWLVDYLGRVPAPGEANRNS